MSKNTIRPTEYRAMQKGEIPAPSNKTKENSRAVNENYSQDVTGIVENAFTPGEVEEVADKVTRETRPLTSEEKMAAFFASMTGMKVSSPAFALPENGEHTVVIYSYEYRNGYADNGDYFKISLKEPKRNITWDMSVPASPVEFMRFLDEINMYNESVVYGLDPVSALGKLQSTKFRVWTQQYNTDKGMHRAKTYSNPVGYEKFARYIASQEAQKADKELAYKQKKARDGKDPWED